MTDGRVEFSAKKLLKSAWSRGGTPYELALSFVDFYSNERTPEKVARDVAGYDDAVRTTRHGHRNTRTEETRTVLDIIKRTKG
eukprot:711705-Prorocentrum_minimum.AAC.2